jgi:hypothetical protein
MFKSQADENRFLFRLILGMLLVFFGITFAQTIQQNHDNIQANLLRVEMSAVLQNCDTRLLPFDPYQK